MCFCKLKGQDPLNLKNKSPAGIEEIINFRLIPLSTPFYFSLYSIFKLIFTFLVLPEILAPGPDLLCILLR
jgi:hypothetical protein